VPVALLAGCACIVLSVVETADHAREIFYVIAGKTWQAFNFCKLGTFIDYTEEEHGVEISVFLFKVLAFLDLAGGKTLLYLTIDFVLQTEILGKSRDFLCMILSMMVRLALITG